MKIILISFLAVILAALGTLAIFYFFAQQQPNQNQADLKMPVTQEPVSLTLNLSSPEDNLLGFTTELLVQGQTTSGAVVILSANDLDNVLEVGSGGTFSTTVKLQSGLNQVAVAAFDKVGNSKSENRTIYYSTEKI